MARLVYGVSGEGSGHSSRAREMAAHLLDQGHDLWLVSYDRGYRNLNFLYRLPDFRSRLSDYEAGDNSGIKSKLDELLADQCILARRFLEARK